MPGTPRDIAYLESKFETGDIPTQQDFYDLFTSFVHYLKIVQAEGSSTSDIMSQKAVSDALTALKGGVPTAGDTLNKLYQLILGKTAIAGVYANIAALLADQSEQEENNYYWVTDATTDPTVDSGWAIYRKLAASTADLDDYVKVQEQESLDVLAGVQSVSGLNVDNTDPANPIVNSRSVRHLITQSSHGFIEKDCLYVSGTTYAKADGTNNTIVVVGVVTRVIDTNNFILTTDGFVQLHSTTMTGGVDQYVQSNGQLGNTMTHNPFKVQRVGSGSQPNGYIVRSSPNALPDGSTRGVVSLIDITGLRVSQLFQTAHGFATGDVLKWTGSGFGLTKITDLDNDIPAGIAIVTSVNTLNLITHGYTVTGLSGLTTGLNYVQSNSRLGTTPTALPYFIAFTSSSGAILPYIERAGAAPPSVGFAIAGTYADIAALLAAQGDQEEDAWYMVLDASADATVTSGWAIYQYLGTTDGDIDDYFKIAEEESLDVVINDASASTKGIVELADSTEAQAGTDTTRAMTPVLVAANTRPGDVGGTEISFAYPSTYGRVTPEDGNITANYTNAIVGQVAKIYHEDSAAPTFPGEWQNVGISEYVPGEVNIILAEYVRGSGVRVEYLIYQPNATKEAVVYKKSGKLSSAQILALGTGGGPEVVPAPGAGKILMFHGAILKLVYNSAAYATHTVCRFEIGNSVVSDNLSTILPATEDFWQHVSANITNGLTSSIENLPIKMKATTGNPTAGNSEIHYTIFYSIVNAEFV